MDRTRFNPRPVQLNRFRERFARELRARGVAAEATPRRARGQGIAGSSMALVKLRARLRTEGGRQISQSDRRTNEQAIAVARGQDQLPPFIAAGTFRWQDIRRAYRMRRVSFQLLRGHVAEWRGRNCHDGLLFDGRNDGCRKRPLLEEAALEIENFGADDWRDAAAQQDQLVRWKLHQLLRQHQRPALFGYGFRAVGKQAVNRERSRNALLSDIADAIRQFVCDAQFLTVVVDPGAFGLEVSAFLRLRAMPGQTGKVAQMLDDIPQVVEAHRVTGADCFVAKLVVCDVQELQTVADRFIQFASTHTAIIQSSTVARRLPKL
jgi:Lrp/AsnC ligand binding domain